MSGISTHVLDVSRGVAAGGVGVRLERESAPGKWSVVGEHQTDADGRVKNLLPPGTALAAAVYRLRFETGAYWKGTGTGAGTDAFHPVVEVTFAITDAGRHHHVPLLVSPFGYTTYRGT